MTSQEQFERAVGEWLAVGPTRLSPEVRAIVRAQIQVTSQGRQARLTWRLPMTQSARIVAVSLVALVFVVGAAVSLHYLSANSGSNPSAVPSGPVGSSSPAASLSASSPSRVPTASAGASAFTVVPAIPASPGLHLAWRTDRLSANAALSAPAIAPDGNVWVASGRDGKFWIFSPAGKLVDTWGTPGNGSGQFNFVYSASGYDEPGGGIAFGPDGSFWVLDTGNVRIQHFNRNRTFLGAWGEFGSGEGQFAEPTSIGLDRAGHVYVADAARLDIQMFDSNGRYLKTFASGLSGPDLRAHPQGWVYTNALPDGSPGLTEYKPDQTVQGTLDVQSLFSAIGGIDIDSAGNIYVSGLTAAGAPEALAEFTANGSPNFLWPTPAEMIAVTPAGDAIYVTSYLWPYLEKYDLPKH